MTRRPEMSRCRGATCRSETRQVDLVVQMDMQAASQELPSMRVVADPARPVATNSFWSTRGEPCLDGRRVLAQGQRNPSVGLQRRPFGTLSSSPPSYKARVRGDTAGMSGGLAMDKDGETICRDRFVYSTRSGGTNGFRVRSYESDNQGMGLAEPYAP